MVKLLENIENEENFRQRDVAEDPFQLTYHNFIKLFRLRKQNVENLEELLELFMPQSHKSSIILFKIYSTEEII